MKYKFIALLILFTIVGHNMAFANTCLRFYNQEKNEPISVGIETTTFSGISQDLSKLVGNTEIAKAMSNLTLKAGLRLQVACITGEIGRGQVHFSQIVESGKDGFIDLNDFDKAMAEAGRKANTSGQPILNTSILVSRPLKPAIFKEDQHYADQVYESIIKQIMLEHHLTREELMNYKSELAGKVWYFVSQTNSKPDGEVVIYDPSKK